MTKPITSSSKLAGVAFDNALSELGRSAAPPAPQPTALEIEALIASFEDAQEVDADGVQFWSARALADLLGYSDYRNFGNAIDKAKVACVNAGQPVENHFVDVTDMVDIGSGAERPIENTRLTRYACYLVAQNGDSRKKPVAFAQTYFAIQTRRQEALDEQEASYAPLTEEQKRLLLRQEIKEHNKGLASAAKNAGVIQPFDFAIFQTFGYKGLYGGLDRIGIQRKKGLRASQQILDHMGSTELAANLFKATQTQEKLQRDQVKGKDNANAVHYEVGQRVRQAIKDIGGTMPENLPPAEDIVKVGRRLQKAIKGSQSPDKKG